MDYISTAQAAEKMGISEEFNCSVKKTALMGLFVLAECGLFQKKFKSQLTHERSKFYFQRKIKGNDGILLKWAVKAE